MITINSISGGKTSAYMATHYPADYELFALVLIEDINCKPKDQSLIKVVSDKIGLEGANEDNLSDLIGYLMLLKIHRNKQ